MRLVDLHPLWLEDKGTRVGVMFHCPHCVVAKRPLPTFLSCFWVPQNHIAGEWGQCDLFATALRKAGLHAENIPDGHEGNDVIPCKRNYAWILSGATFEDMTLQPSLDASAAGHWHGYLTCGEIVGGI